MLDALSCPLRLELLAALARAHKEAAFAKDHGGAAVSDLPLTLLHDLFDGRIPASSISYHLGVLGDAGCIELMSSAADHETRYRIEPHVLVEPHLSAYMPNERGAIAPSWMRIVVDDFGWHQVEDILIVARRQLLVAAEQARERLDALDPEGGTVIVAGIAAFEALAQKGDQG